MLAESAEVRFVGDGDRNVEAEAGGQHVAERHIPPAEVGSEVDEPVGSSRQPDHGDADAGEVVVDGYRRQQRLGELDRILDGLARGESTTRAVDADTVVHVTAEADRRHGDRIDRHLDGENDRPLGVGGDDRRRATGTGRLRRAALDDEAERRQLTDEIGDRRAIQSRERGELAIVTSARTRWT